MILSKINSQRRKYKRFLRLANILNTSCTRFNFRWLKESPTFFCLPTFPRNSNFLKPPIETSHCTLGGAFAHGDLKAKEKISCSHNCLLRSVNNEFVSRETIARHLKASETHFESKTSVDSLLNDSHSKSHWCEPRWWSYLDNLK